MTLRPSDVGRRVVVRHRIDPAEGADATDVLGELTAWAGGVLVVRTRSGDSVEVPEKDVIAAKVIPPRPVPRRDVRDLEAAAAGAWQAPDTELLGRWLLRAAGGFTGRANSCLPLGDPGLPLRDAVDRVGDWYSARGLVPAFQLPGPLGIAVDAECDRRGWPPAAEDVLVMTAPLDVVVRTYRADLPAVTIAAEPDDAWLDRYHYRGGHLPPNARDVLLDADLVGFASLDEGGRRLAVARGAVTAAPSGRRWLGVTAVEVDAAARRRRLASHVMAALAMWARARGATDGYVQVSEANSGARAMYDRLGLTEHHRYHYRRRPGR
jgi:N-acetylglutamate synthase